MADVAVSQASLGTPLVVATPGSAVHSFTTNQAIAAGAYVVAEIGWFDATDTLTGVTVDGNAVDILVQGANSSQHVAMVGWLDTAGRASGKLITATFSGTPQAAVAIMAMSFLNVIDATQIGPTNGTTAAWESASAALVEGGALVAAGRGDGFGTASHVATGGTTEAGDVDSDGTGNCLVYRIEASGGTVTCTGTFTGTASPYMSIGLNLDNGGDPPPEPPVSFVSQGAAVAGTTAITTAAYGAGWADGDFGVCVVASNHATVEATEPTMPAGWDLIGTLNGGGGAQGAGTGNRRLTFFTRTLATGDDTTPTISLATGNVMIAAISVFRKATGNTWDAAVAAFGAEVTAGTGWSQVMTSDPGFAADDMLLAACAVRDTSTTSAEGFSATGATFSALAEKIDSASETGNDISLHVSTADVLTGPSSAAGTRTATHSTSETGVMGVLRIRSTGGSPPVTGTAVGTQAGTGTAVAKVKVPGTAAGTQAGAGAAVAKVKVPATAAGTQAGTGSAVATRKLTGTAVGTQAGTGSATAARKVNATAAGTQAGTGTATATTTHIVPGTAAGTQEGAGSASALVKVPATATGAQSSTGTATATRTTRATATGTQAGTGSATAVRKLTGTAAGTQAGTGSAAGTVIPPGVNTVTGTAAGTQAGTGSAIAIRTVRGTASSSNAGAGSAAGLVKVRGTAAATNDGTGTAVALITVYATAVGVQSGTASAIQSGYSNPYSRVLIDAAEPRVPAAAAGSRVLVAAAEPFVIVDAPESRVLVDPEEARVPLP